MCLADIRSERRDDVAVNHPKRKYKLSKHYGSICHLNLFWKRSHGHNYHKSIFLEGEGVVFGDETADSLCEVAASGPAPLRYSLLARETPCCLCCH